MITSGSGLERFVACRASNVLPRAFDEYDRDDATRGTAVHAYLQRLAEGMTPEESLEQVDERFHDACLEIDLENLSDELGLTAEITLAYNPDKDTARVLGVGLEREYVAAGLTEDEIPVTLDVAGLNDPKSPTRGTVIDYKTGWAKLAKATKNWQMRGGALALARAFDLDTVDAQLIYLRDGAAPKRDRAVFTAADLAMIASEARLRWTVARRDRKAYLATGLIPDATMGSWCKYCPSLFSCVPKMGMVRAVATGEAFAQPLSSMTPDELAAAYQKVQDLKPALGQVERGIMAAARERPIKLEVLEDGTQVWLGVTEVVGNEKLNAEIAREVVKDMLGPDSVEKVSKFTITKELLEAECKKKAPPRKGAEKMRAVMIELRKRRGAHKPVKHDVGTYKIRPRQLAAKTG